MVAVLDAANDRINSVVRLPSWLPTRRNREEKRALRRIDQLLNRFIAEHRASREAPADLLSVLLAATDEESGIGMSDRQLHEEMMTLFLAGHETTAMALTWTWYLLSRHPQVEEKLVDEVSRVLKGRPPTVADLAQLPYTEMVVRESMRLYPPAPGVAREPIEDVRIGGYDVPRGSLITVNTYAMHRDRRFFDDPERFDPERFGPGWEERIDRYAFLPFGGGPRVCIGNGFAMMEARLILATVVQRVRLSLEPGQQIVPMQLVTVRPKHGMRMRVNARRT
jgi:cytochrome P450